MANDSLLAPEAVALLTDVKNYLTSTIVSVEIITEDEKRAAVTLGNELQKKWKAVEDARKKEKGIWDEKSKAVQAEFKPALDLIGEKRNALAAAITKYDSKREIERQARQKALEVKADAERAKVEALSEKQSDRAEMYRKKVEECRESLAKIKADPEAARTVIREIAYYEAKVREFEAKSFETQTKAAEIVMPVIEADLSKVSGTRQRKVPMCEVVDTAAFARWCVEHGEVNTFLVVDETRIKQRIRETEGHFNAPGIVCNLAVETGFSGR